MFKLEIETENDAFQDAGAECARLLRKVAEAIEDGYTSGPLYANGDAVGSWDLS